MSGFAYRWDHNYNQNPIYVGSTNDDIRREKEHRTNFDKPNTRGYTVDFYKHVRKYGSIEDWTMTIIYKGTEYRLFEKNYIKSTWLYNLNEYVPLLTKQEKKDNKQAYYVSNKDIINKKANVYRVANRGIINEKAKTRREANRDKLNEDAKVYRQVNKEKLAEKVKCDRCGSMVRRDNLTRHQKLKKCMAFTQIST